MGYAKEFNFKEYEVPEFLKTWEDVSWHNDVCPRFENYTLMLAVWVDCINPADREFDDWKQYSVCKVLTHGGDDYYLADDTLFATEDAKQLQEWLAIHAAIHYAELALDAINPAPTPFTDIQDDLVTVIAMLKEQMRILQ